MSIAERSRTPMWPSRASPLGGVEKVAVALELLLAGGALAGGAILFFSPDGSAFAMPLSMLDHSGFTTFLVPGLILFVVNGLFPLLSAVATLRRIPWASHSVVAVGVLLVGWITVQVALLRSFHPLHGAYLLLGFVIATLGVMIHRSPLRRPRKDSQA